MTDISLGCVLLFSLASIGLTEIMLNGSVFGIMTWIRDKFKKNAPEPIKELFTCPQCMGTWCGFVCGSAFISTNLYIILGCGFAGSCLSVTYDILNAYVLSKTDLVYEDEDEGNN